MTQIRTPDGLKTVSSITIRDGAGDLRTVSGGTIRDGDNVLRTLTGGGGFGFTASIPDALYQGYGSSPLGIYVTTDPATVTVVGGVAPYTVVWTLSGDAGWAAVNPTSLTTPFRSPLLESGGESNASVYATVTDDNGATAVTNAVQLYAANIYIGG